MFWICAFFKDVSKVFLGYDKVSIPVCIVLFAAEIIIVVILSSLYVELKAPTEAQAQVIIGLDNIKLNEISRHRYQSDTDQDELFVLESPDRDYERNGIVKCLPEKSENDDDTTVLGKDEYLPDDEAFTQ